MSRLAVLGNWHALSNAAQYADALEALGHAVTRIGPRFTAQDANRWRNGLLEMAFPPSQSEADEYAAKVFDESLTPDVETKPGELLTRRREWNDFDAAITFEAYGETPHSVMRSGIPHAVVFGDTHTRPASYFQQLLDERSYDHCFVQFRRSDLAAFDHPSKRWLPAAADPSIWKPYPEVERDIDVLFVGSTHPQVHRDRVELIRYLQANGIDVQVKHAFGSDAARLMARAKVVLHRSLAGDLAMRAPEALMAGACLSTDTVDGLDDLGIHHRYHADVYGQSKEEALLSLRLLLNRPHERTAHRIAGRAVAHTRHTYEARCRALLTTLGLPEEGDASGKRGATAGADLRVVVDGSRPVDAAPHRQPMASPRVSVIVPAFNHFEDATEPLLERLHGEFGCLTGENPRGVDVLVVDDGSTDSTRLRDFIQTARVVRKVNGGFTSAANAGVLVARGDVVVVLNNDTQPEPGFLAPLLGELDQGAGLVGSLILNPDGSIQAAGLEQAPDGTWHNRQIEDAPENYRRDVPAVMGACFAMKRDLYLRLGGLDEFYGSGGLCDVDLAHRVQREGLPVRLRLDSRVQHAEGSTRFHVDGIGQKMAENLAYYRERWGVTRGNDAAVGMDGSCHRRTDVSGGRVCGGARDVSPGDQSGLAAVSAVSACLYGPRTVEEGGSLGAINASLMPRLRDHHILFATPVADHRESVDVDILHYWPGADAHAIPANAKRLIVVQPWEVGPPPPAWRQTWAHPAFRLLITPSAHSERLFLEAFPELQGKTRVIHNGVDTSVFSPEGETWPLKTEAYRFLFVGGPIWRKGIDLLYAAWSKAFLAEDRVKLIVKEQGGDTFYRGQMIAPPAELPNVQRITKDLPVDQLAALYRSVDAMVVPSRYEGFGLAALEGMASGKPVIVTDAPPFTEYVPEDAALFVPSDPDKIARAMRFLFEKRDAGREMGAKGRAASLAYDWNVIASRYAAEVRKVCEC